VVDAAIDEYFYSRYVFFSYTLCVSFDIDSFRLGQIGLL